MRFTGLSVERQTVGLQRGQKLDAVELRILQRAGIALAQRADQGDLEIRTSGPGQLQIVAGVGDGLRQLLLAVGEQLR